MSATLRAGRLLRRVVRISCKRPVLTVVLSLALAAAGIAYAVLALAASMTGKSDYGVDFHLREARRLGLSDQALTEAIEVVQLFNTGAKVAGALRLQPDFDPRSTGRPRPA